MNDVKSNVGIVYHPDYLIHTQSQHPERKERLEYILSAIEESGLKEYISFYDPVPADLEDVTLIHDPEYVKSIDQACRSGKHFLDMDTYIVPDSYRVALLSAGGALTGLRKVLEGKRDKVFTLNRPPGHHAERSRAMGFCLFNNIAIAAAAAKRDYGLKRIAIIDWDVHHGNGTQHSFEDDPEILFLSTHQSPAYPGSGQVREVGSGKGEGFTVNIPLPPGCGDNEYMLFFDKIITPILDQYQPELVMISAGHDAYYKDPLAGMSLTHDGYFQIARSLKDVAEKWSGGKMLLCLEGGYHFQGQAGAVIQVLNALGDWGLAVTEQSDNLEPGLHARQRFEEVYTTQKKYWNI